MTKITTDFVGNETTAVTKQRLTDILAYWGASTAAYTTWGQARTALNALLTSTTAGTIGATELAGTFLPKINFLNDPDEMIADALFGAGEQGVWLDPSDVANIDWRRNLLTQTEAFNEAVWAKTNSTIVPNLITAPDGTLTADKIIEAATDGVKRVAQTAGDTSTATITLYAKQAERSWLYMERGGTHAAYFDISSGIVGNTVGAGTVSSVEDVGGGWYRCRMTCAAATGATLFAPASANGLASYTGDGTSGIYIWGAQLETGTVATEYQRITDLNTEVIERFPNATMYQDTRGQIPVYSPSQPVGLRLDKSKGLVLGPELVVSPVFATQNTNGTVAEAGGIVTATCTVNGTYGLRIPALSAVVGTAYQVYLEIVTNTASKGMFVDMGALTFGAGTTTGNKFGILPGTTSTGVWTLYIPGGVVGESFSARVSSISVKELPGNHATQSTAGSRPMYGIEPKGGRRNLLTWTQDFTNAAWPGYTGWAATSATTVSGAGSTRQTVSGLVVGQTYTLSVDMQKLSGAITGLVFDIGDGTGAAILLPTGAVERRSITLVAGGGFLDIVANNTGSFYISNIQLELGSTATNYQRVTTAFDVTEAGVNTCHYCQYDGSDDGMVTNSIDFTATDKMSVFAGVRKLSDPVEDTLIGFYGSAATAAGDNGFEVQTSEYYSSPKGFSIRSSGPNFTAAYVNNVVAPATRVYSASIVRKQATAAATYALRLNGVAQAPTYNVTGLPTGNFGNFPLYLGRRGGTTNPFNGRDYGILVTGKLANATAIATTEMWLANKTAGVTL